jgi:hypothetical protein
VLFEATSARSLSSSDSKRAYFERSATVKAYVLARAAGHCEACEKLAPFQRKNGKAPGGIVAEWAASKTYPVVFRHRRRSLTRWARVEKPEGGCEIYRLIPLRS